MSGCLFFLHHSVQFPRHLSNRASETDLILLTEALRQRYDSIECVAWQAGEWEDVDALRRHGFSFAEGADPSAWLGERLSRIEPGTTLLIGADREVGRYLIDGLGYEPAEMWSPEVEPNDVAVGSLQTIVSAAGRQCSL